MRTAVRFHTSGAVPFFFFISRRDQRSLQSNRLMSLLVTRPYSPSPPSPPSSLLRWAPVIAPLWAPVIARVMGSGRSVRRSDRRSGRRDPSAGIASACSRKKLKPRTVRPSGSCRSQSSHSAPDEGGNQWPLGVIKHHHGQSLTLTGTQWYSVALSGTQWQSASVGDVAPKRRYHSQSEVVSRSLEGH